VKGSTLGVGVAEEVAGHRALRRADLEQAPAKFDVISEQLRHLRGVGRAADHREQRRPVDRFVLMGFEVERLSEAARDQARAQAVLHRLAETEVGRQRERRDNLDQPRRASFRHR
jgi:hypothetical protein